MHTLAIYVHVNRGGKQSRVRTQPGAGATSPRAALSLRHPIDASRSLRTRTIAPNLPQREIGSAVRHQKVRGAQLLCVSGPGALFA
jgi:hypothetical protein